MLEAVVVTGVHVTASVDVTISFVDKLNVVPMLIQEVPFHAALNGEFHPDPPANTFVVIIDQLLPLELDAYAIFPIVENPISHVDPLFSINSTIYAE